MMQRYLSLDLWELAETNTEICNYYALKRAEPHICVAFLEELLKNL